MPDDTKDLLAAAQAVSELVGLIPDIEALSLPEREMAKRVYPVFVKSFKTGYQLAKKIPGGNAIEGGHSIEHLLKKAEDNVLYYGGSRNTPYLEKAARYGEALGICLGVCEYRIPDPFYDPRIDPKNPLRHFESIAAVLRQEGKKIRLDFIQKRIARITQEQGHLLSDEKRVMLAKIAMMFKE